MTDKPIIVTKDTRFTINICRRLACVTRFCSHQELSKLHSIRLALKSIIDNKSNRHTTKTKAFTHEGKETNCANHADAKQRIGNENPNTIFLKVLIVARIYCNRFIFALSVLG